MQKNKEALIKSKDRVANHGEVFTSEREVNAMLDLVKRETGRIESRFLEPACGHGNFLIKILERKLEVVKSKYKKNRTEYKRYVVLAVSSIYGIDLQEDNITEARERLLEVITSRYTQLYKTPARGQFLTCVQYILSRNVVVGDALTMQTKDGKPIIFPEWSMINGNKIKRRDFSFGALLKHREMSGLPLFSKLNEKDFLPKPVKDYA